MIPSERRWRGSLRLIKSRLFKIRHSGTALSGEESAAPPLQIPHCYVPRNDKTYKFGLRLSTVNLVIPNRLYRLRKKSESRRFAASGAKALAGFARLTRR